MKNVPESVEVMANAKGAGDRKQAGISNKWVSCHALSGLNERPLSCFNK